MRNPFVTFDHTSPDVGSAVLGRRARVQRQGPLVWVESNGGFWAATSFDVVLQIAQDWETFSNLEGVALKPRASRISRGSCPSRTTRPASAPIAPQVNPHLTIRSLAGLEQSIRNVADELIDAFIQDGSCDIAVDFARKFPGTVFFRLIVHCGDEDFRHGGDQVSS